MKVAVCLLVVVLVVSIEALTFDLSRVKRGFRSGAADRFSHGFGKRTEGADSLDNTQRAVMSVDELVELIRGNPKLAYLLVRHYMDADGDGLISREELFRPTEEEQ